MGMRVGGTNAWEAAQATSASGGQQRRQSFSELLSSVQSGDLASAQAAYVKMTGGKPASGDGPLAKIGAALQSGDLQGAQQIAQSIQAHRGGHHHGYASQAVSPAQGSSSSASPGVGSTSSTDGAGGVSVYV
jgi:hypothetical protein